jgi:hypothetical protein
MLRRAGTGRRPVRAAAWAGLRPQLLIDAAEAIPRFDRPVLLIWGEACDFGEGVPHHLEALPPRLAPVLGFGQFGQVDDEVGGDVSEALADVAGVECLEPRLAPVRRSRRAS